MKKKDEVIDQIEIPTNKNAKVEKMEKEVKKIASKIYLYAGESLTIGMYVLEKGKIYTVREEIYNTLISQIPKLKDILLEINNVNSKKIFKDLEDKKAYFKKISSEIRDGLNKVGDK